MDDQTSGSAGPAAREHSAAAAGAHSERTAAEMHAPVMERELLDIFAPALQAPGSVYLDCTLGMAGHACAVLAANPEARLVGIDRDSAALELARGRLTDAGFDGRFSLHHATYDEIPEVLDAAKVAAADAILMDLGLSSFQIDTRDRGFAYSVDAPLDMRMNASGGGATAADLVNTLEEQELTRILSQYGEERFARRIARSIVQRRAEQPFTRSGDLVEVIDRSIPAKSKRTGGHPAKRTFQALRIAVNDELDILQDALEAALGALADGGRLAVESYHSLEDRMVKRAFTAVTTSSAPLDLPVELPELAPDYRLVHRGAKQASAQEQETNTRSASVRLRAVERTARTATSQESR
ncbi:16S rRNA (cytosine(1402)-N(4))-methyltransferase RsmH [Helcobacillus massiliensis]|uniref:Ribosomal RNA small subunit methyltransferase H n=1 Tax=Helcobacillus massiliensis TaxID=521392 RepID=A0A839QSU6_9MICO|nr:16S rRNA (cytosine1402-N4)-methyltransferase [Helcobacillus massiliensis]